MDKAELVKSVESLRQQLNMQRAPISKTAGELRKFVAENEEVYVAFTLSKFVATSLSLNQSFCQA